MCGNRHVTIYIDEEGNIDLPEIEDKDEQQNLINQLRSDGKIKDGIPFETRVAEALKDKPLAMADTMTLLKYERCLDTLEKNAAGSIKDSICMCDEADCEFLDARPYEITGRNYSQAAQEKRFDLRKKADILIKNAIETVEKNGEMVLGSLSPQEIQAIAKIGFIGEDGKKTSIPLDFLMDAYNARTMARTEGEDYTVGKNGEIITLNQNKRCLEVDTQGHQQAIYAMRANNGIQDQVPAEKEVIDVKYPYNVIGKYEVQSLISGTMEDRNLSEHEGTSLYDRYMEKRQNLFESMGFYAPVNKGRVVDFRNFSPQKREDLFMNMSLTESGLKDNKGFSLPKGQNWKTYVEANEEQLEDEWRQEINDVIGEFSEKKAVLVSVKDVKAGERLGASADQVYTAANKIPKGEKEKYHKGEVFYLDDSFGRGNNPKFEEGDGHVIVTNLPINSRNLEQFVNRVARGDNNGTTTTIISPTDPKLVEFLTDMDKRIKEGTLDNERFMEVFSDEERASLFGKDGKALPGVTDAYFTKLLRGDIPIDRLVYDIYPEETISLMNQMTGRNTFAKESENEINTFVGYLQRNQSPYAQYMEDAMRKARTKEIRTFNAEEPLDERVDSTIFRMHKESAINVALAVSKKLGRTMDESDFYSLLLPGFSDEEKQQLYGLLNERTQGIIETTKVEERSAGKDPIMTGLSEYEIDADEVAGAAQGIGKIMTKEARNTALESKESDEVTL